VSRKNPDKSRFLSEEVRNYLGDALEKSIINCGVFKVGQDDLEATPSSRPAHISVSIVSVRKYVVGVSVGPWAGAQKGFLDAEMEVRLARPSQADLVISGKSHVSQSEQTLIVAPRQFKDWTIDDSWASVACTEALQNACGELARKIKASQAQLEHRAAL
jgi:hypothetical protein